MSLSLGSTDTGTNQRPPVPKVTKQHHLAIDKVVRQFAFVERSYQADVLGDRDKLKHDLALMLAYGDLNNVHLELLGTDRAILFQFTIRFNGEQAHCPLIDPSQGIELPLIDRREVASTRLRVMRNGGEQEYRQHLLINWTKVDMLPRRPGDSYGSEHAAKISGGRQQGEFHVGRDFRHRLVISNVVTRGYAFAHDLDLRVDGVFLHPKFSASNLVFRPGNRVTAIVVQTPRGLQARSIQAA